MTAMIYGRVRARAYYVSTVRRDEKVIPRVHTESGKRRQTVGPNHPVALTGHRKAAQEIGAALATPHSRFERLTI